MVWPGASLAVLADNRFATLGLSVILRNPAGGGATKNLSVKGFGEILRGVNPELADGLRTTFGILRMETN